MELLPSWTKAGSWSLGRDPLGMQATSVRLYRDLVPGLTNVTNRLRYYSFYCWVIRYYERKEHSDDEAKWRVFIRRAEALYALASNVVDPQQSDGLAGNFWAGAFCQPLPAGTIDLRPYTDHPGTSGQYLKATRGNFGQFYIASMTEVGLLDASSSRIPIVSEPLGRDMANAFANSVGPTIDLISKVIRTGKVTRAELVEIGEAAHPSRIPVNSREMTMLREYLLAANEKPKSGIARRSSAWLLLDLIRLGIPADDQSGFRRAFYNRNLPDGSLYASTGLTIDRWQAFQANELCHISFEALLNGILAELQGNPLGLEPNILVKKMLEPLLTKLNVKGRSWDDWATEIGLEYAGSEETLAQPILSALADLDLASSQEGLSSALQLIATLWHRWGKEHDTLRVMIERDAGKGARSLSGVLNTLNGLASKSVEQVLHQTLRSHLIADHLAIAGRKLAATGTFTYHFTLSDGVLSDGRLTLYTYTNPRLRNLMRFLRDAALFDGASLTPAGMRFLNESQPV